MIKYKKKLCNSLDLVILGGIMQYKRWIYAFFVIVSSCAPLKKATQYYDTGDYRPTIKECKRLVKEDSSRADAYYLMGRAYQQIGVLDSARWALHQAWQKSPSDTTFRQALATVITTIADSGKKQANERQAIQDYTRALVIDSTTVPAYLGLASLYQDMGWHDRAKETFQSGLQVATDKEPFSVAISALDSLEQASKELTRKGAALIPDKKFDLAITLLEQALELKPDNEDAKYHFHMAMGRKLSKTRNDSQLWDAIEHFGLAAALRPNLGAPHYFMGLAYHKKNKKEYDNALSELDKAVSIQPQGPYAEQAAETAKEIRRRRKLLKEFWGHE
jgi:tetratricopeptide (TPR) repeat protein